MTIAAGPVPPCACKPTARPASPGGAAAIGGMAAFHRRRPSGCWPNSRPSPQVRTTTVLGVVVMGTVLHRRKGATAPARKPAGRSSGT